MKRLTELEKYQQEMDRRKKEEEEKRLREEQERKKREEEQRKREEQERKKKEEEERKQKEEYERIGKWKSTKAPDFTGDIFEAAKDGKLTSVIYLLANGSQIQAKDPSNDGWHYIGFSPLHYASHNGHLSVVEYLVNQKAYINARDNENLTPLHLAANNGHLSVVEYLVNQKADINAKNNGVEFLYLIILLFRMRVVKK